MVYVTVLVLVSLTLGCLQDSFRDRNHIEFKISALLSAMLVAIKHVAQIQFKKEVVALAYPFLIWRLHLVFINHHILNGMHFLRRASMMLFHVFIQIFHEKRDTLAQSGQLLRFSVLRVRSLRVKKCL